MNGPVIRVRDATKADLAAINAIYNHYVLHSTCTYQEQEETMASRERWFGSHGANHPVIVAELEGTLAGWGSLSPYHARSAFRFTVENSIYVHHQFHRRGIGALLLKELVARARETGHHSIIAAIDAGQPGSIALHERHGFATVGRLRHAGFKFNRWLDVVYMQLMLDTSQ